MDFSGYCQDYDIRSKDYTMIIYMNHKLYLNLMTGLNIYYTSNFLDAKYRNEVFKLFESDIVYNSAEESKVMIHGKYVQIPRTQTAYGESGTFYRFAGTVVKAKSWNESGAVEDALRKIVDRLELYTQTRYNFCLINRYENGSQYIGPHSDDETDLEARPSIAGISLGSTRKMYFSNGNTNLNINLEPGSLIWINYPTNTYWKHSVPKTSKQVGVRVSLTFRKMR